MNNQPAILYVEDDTYSREIMTIILNEIMGLPHVTMFEESTDFLTRLQALDPKPDVILLDIHVPPYSGFEMLQMIRTDPQFNHVPVVALTASVMNEEIEEIQKAGFVGVIAKPVDMDAFPEMLASISSGQGLSTMSKNKVS